MSNDSGEGENPSDGEIDRRSCLRWAGVTGVGLGVGGASSGALGGLKAVDRPDPSDGGSSPSRASESEILVGVERDRDDLVGTVEHYVPGNAEVVHENADLSYVAVRFPDEAAERARENFASAVVAKDGIRYAEPNTTLSLGYTPSDPQFSDQTAAKMVNADDAWDLTVGNSDVTIAVLDQGVKYDHPDLAENMDGSVTNHGKDFVNDDSDPYPEDLNDEFHGTHITGIAAAAIDNGEGVAGISQASILNGRVVDEAHSGTASDLADGISWATNEGVDIINISLGGGASSVLKDAVEYAYRNGVLLVAAAGNAYGDAVDYPAAYDECIAVSSLDHEGNLAGFSNVGNEVELTAPGMAVVSTTTTDGYGIYSGTSMAAPMVSGVAALALSKWSLSNDELREHLRRTAVDVGLAAQEQGYGRVDAYEAVSTAPDATVVDDFEDSDLSEYSFDRGSSGASIASSPTYSGSQALEISGANTEMISTSGLSAYPSAGDTFSYWVRATGDVEDVNLTYGVQDHDDRYFVRLDFTNDDLMLFRYENGSLTRLGYQGPSLSTDTWYEVEVNWGSSGDHVVTLYDGGGTQLGQVTGSDSTWMKGGVGYDAYLGSRSGAVYFDNVTIGATDDSNEESTIEDFEDGGLGEYTFLEGSSSATVVNSPTYSGSHALELVDATVGMNSTSGLPTYPSAGDAFRCRMRLANGTENGNFTYGVQDDDNRYYVKLNGDKDGMWLFRYENGSGTTLAGESGIGLSPDTWYEIEVEWRSDGDHIVTLTDDSGSVLSQIVGTDSTWTDGGIGFDSYLASSEAIYFDSVTRDASGGGGQELSVVDDFEDGDLAEYANTGSTGWTAQNSFAFDGSYAAANASNHEAIHSDSYTYSRGDEFELRAYLESHNGVSTGIEQWFCTNADATEKYVHYVSAEDNKHFLTYQNGIDQKVIDSATVDIPSDEWLRLRIRSDDTTLTGKVYDAAGNLVSSVSGKDANLTNGGYGFRDEWRSEGPDVFVDAIRG